MSYAVAVWGIMPPSACNLEQITREFGWDLERLESAASLARLKGRDDLVAVIAVPFSLAMDWSEILRDLRVACPRALPIVATTFSDHTPWHEMADAGAFHSIAVPMKTEEVRQSLGFVATAIDRMARVQSARPVALRAVA
jgi:DNA-binding NtrC family response regulator